MAPPSVRLARDLDRSLRLARTFAEYGCRVDYRTARRPSSRLNAGGWTELWTKEGVTWAAPCGRRFDSPDAVEAFLQRTKRKAKRTLLAAPGSGPARYAHTLKAEANAVCSEAAASAFM